MSAQPIVPCFLPNALDLSHSFDRRITAETRKLAAPAQWLRFVPDCKSGLQNFTPALVAEFQDILDGMIRPLNLVSALPGANESPRYTVVQSGHPDYFSVGGDLRFFHDCIETRDAQRLRAYSMACLNLMHGWSTRLRNHHSIALVQGRALGGGFEMLLSTDYVIAEQRSSFGFPEIMFGLFPCTGAMGLLSSRVGARQAERMMTDGRIYSAAELYEMKLIDELCDDGEGELAVERYLARHLRRQQSRMKVQQSRQRTAPIDYDEGVQVVEDWVETAMNLSAEEVRTMEMLILMQSKEASARPRAAAQSGS